MHALTLHAALPLLGPILALQVAVTSQKDARPALERGRRLYETGQDLPGARAALDEAIRVDPQLAEAYLYRALVTMEAAKLADAEPDFKKALTLAPNDPTIHRFYGEELASAGRYDEAEQHYQRALAIDPKYADVMYLYGDLDRQRRRLDQAIPRLEEHARLVPKGTAHHALGEIFLEKGDLVRAEKEFELDLGTDETCYESRVNLAGLLLDRGDFSRARDHYQKSLEFHPADARALSGLGEAYLELGDSELALGTLRQAQDLAPLDPDVDAALRQARWRLRLRLGWPIAAGSALLGAALGATAVLARARRKAGSRS